MPYESSTGLRLEEWGQGTGDVDEAYGKIIYGCVDTDGNRIGIMIGLAAARVLWLTAEEAIDFVRNLDNAISRLE